LKNVGEYKMSEHLCPWWVGYLLASPVRKLFQKPEKILLPYVKPGMTVLDVGCAMGFFSLPMAKMVGSTGRVMCVDLQEIMIKTLNKRAAKAGLADQIEARTCSKKSLGIDDLKVKIDFALAFAVLHEIGGEQKQFLSEIYASLVPKGNILIAEPKGHISSEDFGTTIETAKRTGFVTVNSLDIKKSRAVLLKKMS